MKFWRWIREMFRKIKHLFLPLSTLCILLWLAIHSTIMAEDKTIHDDKLTLSEQLNNPLKIVPLGTQRRINLNNSDLGHQSVLSNKTVNDKELTLSDFGNIKRFPKFLIIGAPECGMSALMRFLNAHAQLVPSGNDLNFFQSHYDKGTEWFLNQMPFTAHWQLAFQKSSGYFTMNADAIERIKTVNPRMKFLVIVCDPTNRAVSHYLQAVAANLTGKDNTTITPFEEIVLTPEDGKINVEDPIIDRGLYAKHLQTYYKVFPKEQFHIIKQGEFFETPWVALGKVEAFLKLVHVFHQIKFYFNKQYGIYCHKSDKTQCRSDILMRYDLQQYKPYNDVMNKLKQFYEEQNKDFAQLVGMDFEWA
ncbi:unnamed protein product [Owenia fusiformis]|uniref:Sulfotransferase domain-containing protein n=1 Tax=Owenia fusiformis TaxID=6347 RepID=A0A8S4NRN4_OWEFU|nr:unnamed protein product [Owenia fusiformis]